ncbi:MAG TPA: hypothetical protein VFO35_20080 [Steroidobacteraceae bacterium]|nr:hypothetical protein [Steroidobacteraceae bacterium]
MRRAERLAAWLVLVAAGAAVALLGASPASQLLAVGGFGAVAFGLWRAGWIGSSHRVIDLQSAAGKPSADTRVYSGAVWLGWKRSDGHSDYMFLVRGDVPAGQLRALCVRLRTGASGRENVQ